MGKDIVATMIQASRKPYIINTSVDYHAHILPCCDHGSDSIETSRLQLKWAASSGIDTVCATPHFYPHKDTVDSFLQRRSRTYEALLPFLTDDIPHILLGAEVLICDGIEKMNNLKQLCLQGTDELLLEMPFFSWSTTIWDTLFRLNARSDIQIVIAHADRYPQKNIETLIEKGIPLQINTDCLLKPLKRKTYLFWIRKGYVMYLGSDIHGTARGYQSWKKGVKMLNKCVKTGKKGEF